MKKAILTLSFIFLQFFNLTAQPSIMWAKCYGGTKQERPFCIIQTSDKGYLAVGDTNSPDGDVTGYQGIGDGWVIKLDSVGNLSWQKCIGGTSSDRFYSVLETNEGEYILTGVTYSIDGDINVNHGEGDVWVVKLDEYGDIIWSKCYGGHRWESGNIIRQTVDGGYIVTGFSNSYEGDVSGNHGNDDVWLLKLDVEGNIEWQKSLGGSQNDEAKSILQTEDEGFIIVGFSNSNDGDVSGNHLGKDWWIVKTSSNGIIEWQKCLGGSDEDDETAYSVSQTLDGGFIIVGMTRSLDGDVIGNHGISDGWLVKLDTQGVIEWTKCIGGTSNDEIRCIQNTNDGGFVMAGLTWSDDGDVSGNNGFIDYWIVKINDGGDIEWQKCLGGWNEELAFYIEQTFDEGFIIAGYTGSNNGDVSGNHGYDDFWIVRLCNNSTLSIEISNPIYCSSTNLIATAGFESYLWNTGDTTQSIKIISGGLYYVTAYNENGCPSEAEFEAPDPTSLPLSIEVINPDDCYNTLSAVGDFESFTWNTGATTQSINITEGGTYFVTAINASGCTSEATIDLPDPTPLPITIKIANPDYCFSTELIVVEEFSSYLWSTGDTTQIISISSGGEYQVTGFGEMGCQSETIFDAPNPIEPYSQSEICMVTLDEEIKKNVIVYEPVKDVGIDSILIFRLNNLTSEYEWIGSNSIDSAGILVDQESLPSQQNYQYKIEVRDTCGRTSSLSEMHQTMLLQSNVGINNEINLFWNAYLGFDYANFGIYRSNNGGEFILIANVPNNTYTFIDLFPPSGEKIYQIRIERTTACNPDRENYFYVASNAIVLQPSAVSEHDINNLLIYPNPFTESLAIERINNLDEMEVELIDTYGRVQNTYTLPKGIKTITISTEELIPGVYYLRFNRLYTRRILKNTIP